MVTLSKTISCIRPFKALVVGDLVLDTYTIGKAKRISPEAPVAIVNVQQYENRPGMSGNVAMNLLSLGAEVTLFGRVGNDSNGTVLLESLKSTGLGTDEVVVQEGYMTPVKNRIIADHQQIVRVDHEIVEPINELLEEQLIAHLQQKIKEVDVVAISDYAKGFLTKTLLSALFEAAQEQGVPTVVDPKGVDFTKYAGATVVKPNYNEALAASGLDPQASLEEIAHKVMESSHCEMLMVTRSESGASLFQKDGSHQTFPVRSKEVVDVTGAGDTVLAALTCAMANHIPMDAAIRFCNAAAGIAIGRFGCARVSLSDIARSILHEDSENKVFDDDNLFALQKVISDRHVAILGLHSDRGLTAEMYRTICQVANHKQDRDLIVYLIEKEPPEEMVAILSAIEDVDYLVINHDSLRKLCSAIDPDEVLVYNHHELQSLEDPSKLIGSIV